MPNFALKYHHPDLITEVTNFLGLRSQGFVEKDLFVTKAIEVVNGLENDFFRLIFSGGTCLAKAHKIINRVSEDIDFRVAQTVAADALNKEQFRRELRRYRQS